MNKAMSSIPERVKRLYDLHRWQGRSLFAVTFLLLILLFIRATLAPTLIYATTDWLGSQGIDAHIEDIDINLIDGSVSLIDAEGNTQGKPLFTIGRIEIHWSWTPLSDKVVDITDFEIVNLSVNIERYDDAMIIGGVVIPEASDETAVQKDIDAGEGASPWAISLGEVHFTNLKLCYKQHDSPRQQARDSNRRLDYCAELDEMLWRGSIAYAMSQKLLDSDNVPITSTGDFKLDGLTVTDNRLLDKQQAATLLYSQANELQQVTVDGLNNIAIEKVTMSGLSALQRDDVTHKDAVRFSELLIDKIAFTSLNDLSIDGITLVEPGVYLVRHDTRHWEYQRWLPGAIDKQKKAISSTNTDDPHADKTPFKLALRHLQVTEPDLCYLEQGSPRYYCYTQASLNWNGEASYSTRKTEDNSPQLYLDGSLKMKQTRIRNHSIQRDLLVIDAMRLDGLRIKEAQNVHLKKLQVSKLDALQRSKAEDDFTTRFSKLTVNGTNYLSDSLLFDTVILDGLSGTISKNKDGRFEYDKWLSENSEARDSNKDHETPDNNKNKTLRIGLNKLKITSEKEIDYIDNSTRPAMNLGLRKLAVSVGALDPKKPDHDTPVKLFARTTRHGTVGAEGTIRPYAEKISFDIDGKLKGFDLRAITPETRKAIGHIIKSGQMDADLNLLAKDGQLDSAIDLALYQFNIESMSKKDADELDKLFGMPLNQTLQLLRDKDGSIHLEIPVTGDINKPSFDPMDAIIKATSKAATVTLITFYTPYGLVYAGGNVLFDLASAMSFEPVIFPPGSSTLDDAARQQLDKLSQLLNEKPGIHLSLCGMSNRKDAVATYPELDSDEKKARPDEAQVSTMTELAKRRQQNAKDYLIDKRGIAHDRLILCAPVYDDNEDAPSGVEINI